MEHLDILLTGVPPFDGLPESELRALVETASECVFETGEDALVEDARPAPGLFVVVTGSMELVHDGEVVEVIEPGECFGHPSLLSGMAPAFTVRAHEPSICALIDREHALRLLASEPGVRFVATTMRTRLTRTGHTVHGLLDVGTTPVSAIMRAPVLLDAAASLREAVSALDPPEVSVLLLPDGNEMALLGDGDVRAWLAHGGSLEDRARAAALAPAPTVPADQLAVEATVDMLASGSEHVAVMEGERVRGTLSATDLIGLDARSPIALRHTILAAADEPALERAAARLPQLFALLFRAGVPPRDLGRVLSLQHDALTARLIDFSIWRHGAAPVPWAWLDLGSAARREFTLASDQDNALAYEEPPAGTEQEVDEYFARLAQEVNAGLAACGFGIDNNDVLAGNRQWRMSRAQWVQTFEECLRNPSESRLIRASVAFDFRTAAGGLAIGPALVPQIRAAREHPDLMRLLARTATGYPVALGFAGHLAVEKRGESKGMLDLKRGAIVPLVNVVRFHAIAAGVTVSPTLDRLAAVASVGSLPAADARSLAESFEAITRLRFEHHAQLIAEGRAPENLIEPAALPPIARIELHEALQTVKRAQKRLGAWVPAGL